MDFSTPAFIQGCFSFSGMGLEAPQPLEGASYQVPRDKRAQVVYLRAGNSADALVALIICRNGKPMRYLPLGAKNAMHVPLAVVEDQAPESKIELLLAAPKGVTGTVVVDVGFIEI